MKKLLTISVFAISVGPLSLPVYANEQAVIEALVGYFDFVEYGGATIFPQQIPEEAWKKMFVIDARDQAQFDKGHIPGAMNIEWRQVLAKRSQIPKDKPVLIYCNQGTLSAQAGLALRLVGYDNVRILQGGIAEWKARGGFDTASQANGSEGR